MTKRSPVAAALLSMFIPFYAFYWFYVTAQVMKKKGGKIPPFVLLVLPLLTLFLYFLTFFGIASTAHGQASTGAAVSVGAFVLLLPLLILASVVLSIVYEYRFCKAAEQVTRKKVNGGLTFILMLVLLPVGVYMVQDALN